MNFGNDIAKKNWIAKIGRLKKEKEKNKTVARVMLHPHTILPYFLQTVVMTNFLQFSLVPTNNTTFLFINNDSSHQ